MRFRVLTIMLLTYIALTLTLPVAFADDKDDLSSALEKAKESKFINCPIWSFWHAAWVVVWAISV